MICRVNIPKTGVSGVVRKNVEFLEGMRSTRVVCSGRGKQKKKKKGMLEIIEKRARRVTREHLVYAKKKKEI
jgi:hypothetical protein